MWLKKGEKKEHSYKKNSNIGKILFKHVKTIVQAVVVKTDMFQGQIGLSSVTGLSDRLK